MIRLLAQSAALTGKYICFVKLGAIDMKKNRILASFILSIVVFSFLGGCHTATHLPPGQVKKFVNPPPGHGGIPPGHLKK